MNKSIRFTNLGIVKSIDFELTESLFFDKMNRLINDNVNEYGVNYDEESKKYQIIYNSQPYDVKYLDDDLTKSCKRQSAVELLDKLVEITNVKRKIQKEKGQREKEKLAQKEKILRNIKSGSIKTNDEKLTKIELLKDDFKDQTSILRNTREIFKKMNYRKPINVWDEAWGLFEVALGIVAFLVGVITYNATSSLAVVGTCTIAFLISIVDLRIWSESDRYHGILNSILSVVSLPLILGFSIVKKIVKKIKLDRNVGNIKKTIIKDNKNNKFDSKIKINTKNLSDFLNNTLGDSITKESMNQEEIITTLTEIKNNILEIKDKSVSKELTKNLFEIINYYQEACNNVKTGSKNTITKILTSELKDIKIKSEEELQKEKNQETANNKCDELIESINYQKSIGSR